MGQHSDNLPAECSSVPVQQELGTAGVRRSRESGEACGHPNLKGGPLGASALLSGGTKSMRDLIDLREASSSAQLKQDSLSACLQHEADSAASEKVQSSGQAATCAAVAHSPAVHAPPSALGDASSVGACGRHDQNPSAPPRSPTPAQNLLESSDGTTPQAELAHDADRFVATPARDY